MLVKDHQGHVLSGASTAAAEDFRRALNAYHCYAGDAPGLVEKAIADSPGFTMAHVLKAYLCLFGANAEVAAQGVAAFESARALPANSREQGHVAALGALIAGEIRGCGRILEDVVVANPHDVLALQAGQLCDFTVGDSRMLRDRIGRVLPHWSEDRPDHHAILGMLAFGLEETGLYDRAEAAGRRAVELERRNGWAWHAVAHVLEMQDRRADGVAWLRGDLRAWTEESFFQTHNWWHLALYHLGLGEMDEVLRLFDGPIFGARSNMSVDLIDAGAMLWRLHLLGVDLGSRWSELADLFEGEPRGAYAFDDAHAMMAFVGAQRWDKARELIEAQRYAIEASGDNAEASRDAGLPIMRALLAYGEGDFGRAVDLLRTVRSQAIRFGGSHAQRDIVDLTLIAAAGKAGEFSLEQTLLAERAAAKPLASVERRRLAA